MYALGRVWGKSALFANCSRSLGCAQGPLTKGMLAKTFVIAGLALAILVLPNGSASAQNGFFDMLFGRWSPGNSASAYADPNSPLRAPDANRGDSGGSVAFCVRVCDGRYFPMQRHGGITPAQTCSSFCPASQTKIYSGGGIDQAVGTDGKRYAELSTAFVYREKIVPGCTCNGKDAFGLINTPIEDDPTLHPGDIVATNSGLMAYSGGAKRQNANLMPANFTPIESYPGLSADLRRKLTETKITPAAETPAPPAQVKPADAGARNGKNKRVQLDR